MAIACGKIKRFVFNFYGMPPVQKLFEVFEDSKLAELSARTLHLEESYQTLIEQKKGLSHQYFQSRHEAVDAEMRDLFSAQIVRKKAKKKAFEDQYSEQ